MYKCIKENKNIITIFITYKNVNYKKRKIIKKLFIIRINIQIAI